MKLVVFSDYDRVDHNDGFIINNGELEFASIHVTLRKITMYKNI